MLSDNVVLHVIQSLCVLLYSVPTTTLKPRGVLEDISDGEVRSPFLGLKLAIWDFF